MNLLSADSSKETLVSTRLIYYYYFNYYGNYVYVYVLVMISNIENTIHLRIGPQAFKK